MRYYPAFIDLEGKKVVFSGAGTHAAAKIRLLLKTPAEIHVFGNNACSQVTEWAETGKVTLHGRAVEARDIEDARLVYGANDNPSEDKRVLMLARKASVLGNIVDNLEDSEFLTPALVDRAPVTVAIGTEGTAPVLARQIKAMLEQKLPASTGILARIADQFRPAAAKIPDFGLRRDMWRRFFAKDGLEAHAKGGETAVRHTLCELIEKAGSFEPEDGHVSFVGAGTGDPGLLTIKAHQALHDADVVIHDSLVSDAVLELARREATLIHAGKRGYRKSMPQEEIKRLMVKHAQKGKQVVRLKSGDPSILARLDEELDALEAEQISFDIVPGITTASAAAAAIGSSLTRRGRNSELTILSGHDMKGFAEHEWAKLAKPGATAAIYMGLKAATFICGRLRMHGADAETPVTIAWNVSRSNQQIVASSLGQLPETVKQFKNDGPAILLYGIKPRAAFQTLDGIATGEATDLLEAGAR